MTQIDKKTVDESRKTNIINYKDFHEGDDDPATGKKIVKIIMTDPTFIVFLDKEMRVEWNVTDEYENTYGGYSDYYGKTLNKATLLEGLSSTFKMTKGQKKEFGLLVGNAIARMLEKSEQPVIIESLTNAETFLNDRMKEKAKIWFLSSSFLTLFLASISIILYSTFLNNNYTYQNINIFELFLSTCFGALGAMISIIRRSNKLNINLSSGRTIHYIEGTTRILVGMIGALLLFLLIKADIFLGILSTSSYSFSFLLSICMAAGGSERLVPSLIKQAEEILTLKE
jgi:hypothetical protein